ncbi:MAG: hypothetical protein ACREVT_08585 [Burkholderiales bacterium]
MPPNSPVSPYRSDKDFRVQQGDIYRDVTLVDWAHGEDQVVVTASRDFPFVVVLTQDCDLFQDFNNRTSGVDKHDKYLQSILLCPAYRSAEFRTGQHLQGLNLVMENWASSTRWKLITENQSYRHHYLPEHAVFQIPELVIDFKHFITAPRDAVYRDSFRAEYRATIAELYRENLSVRFAQYLSRIALPETAEI